MKPIPQILLFLFATSLLTAATFKLAVPNGPLNETEKMFVGKWSGSRANIRWEIERFADRRFELAFQETDLESPDIVYHNYASGHWWALGENYYFEWEHWWGDHGDFSGVIKESIHLTSSDQIVTLTPGHEDPENIEVRVSHFSLPGWQHKPDLTRLHDGLESQQSIKHEQSLTQQKHP